MRLTETLKNKISQSEAFASGFLDGFFGPVETAHVAGLDGIHSSLQWLEGWVEGSKRRVVEDLKVSEWLANTAASRVSF